MFEVLADLPASVFILVWVSLGSVGKMRDSTIISRGGNMFLNYNL